MIIGLFLVAIPLLAIERLCYVWAWNRPGQFARFCAHPLVAPLGGEPVAALEQLFYGFKILQISVFLLWCVAHGNGVLQIPPTGGSLFTVGVGFALLTIGQMLNFGVFYRLGKPGVFYGVKFGYDVPWCTAFPFSLMKHPQYFGTLMSIWGVFLAVRYPHEDWIVLPLLETVYYTIGARYER